MKAEDVNFVVTNCYRPAWTKRGIESIRKFYPDNRILVVDDNCIDCTSELAETKKEFGVELLSTPERLGAGKAIDLGVARATSDWVLTYDHGVTLKQPILDLFLPKVAPDVIGVGRRGGGNYCAAHFGAWLTCSLALWNRRLITKHNLSFKLTSLFLPEGCLSAKGTNVVTKCTTGQYLCYRAVKLGFKLSYVNLRAWHTHEHARDTFGRGWPSKHERHDLEPGEIFVGRAERKKFEKKRRWAERREERP